MPASNSLQKNSLIAKAVVRGFRNNLLAAKNSTKNLTETFRVKGYKGGDTISIKYPVRYVSGLGAPISKNDTTETTTTLTLIQRNLALGFLTKDLTLTVNNVQDYVDEAIAQLMSDVDQDAFALYYKSINLTTPGAYVANGASLMPAAWTGADISTFAPIVNATARLSEKGVQVGGRIAALTPSAHAAMTDSLKGLFQSSEQISDQYTKGVLGIIGGFTTYTSMSLPRHTAGTRTATGATVTGAGQTGTSLLLGSAGNTLTITRGDQFVIAGVNAINPLTRQATNKLQIFTVQALATSDAGGVVTVSILPSISVTAPNQTVSALPGAGAALTFMGAASASTEVNMAWQKDALVSAWVGMDDDLPGADASVATDPDSGITVRVAKFWDGLQDEKITRLDILYGFQIVRPEAVVRIQA